MDTLSIQSQITLVDFRATKVRFDVVKSRKFEPVFDLKLSDGLLEDEPNTFDKIFDLLLTIPDQNHKRIITADISFRTTFRCSVNLNKEFFLSDFARISAPAIGFPYLRSFVTTITVQAGYPPVILPSINFVQFSKERELQKI
jgi:preprotein translocase subunit SecB